MKSFDDRLNASESGYRIATIVFAAILLTATATRGETVVLTNGVSQPITFSTTIGQSPARTHHLDVADALPLRVSSDVELAWQNGPRSETVTLKPDAIYYFVPSDQGMSISRLNVRPRNGHAVEQTPRPDEPPDAVSLPPVLPLPVKLIVVEPDPKALRLHLAGWQRALRAVSPVLERYAGVRPRVVAMQGWQPPRGDESGSLAEAFEAGVDIRPARLAIAIVPKSLLKEEAVGRPLGTHRFLVIDPNTPLDDQQRAGVLLHALGHWLGALHSTDAASVMQPADGESSTALRFDPINVFLMQSVSQSLLRRPVEHLSELPPTVRDVVRPYYAALAQMMPDDPLPTEYLALLERPIGLDLNGPNASDPLIAATGRVIEAIVLAAESNRAHHGTADYVGGDRLTEHCIRAAATAAAKLPPEHATKAFLLGIGVGLDKGGTLARVPVVGSYCRRAETDSMRRRRIAALGKPTIAKREDLALHFAVSCGLTALAGPTMAETVATLKEVRDAQRGGSGFSFADLTADLAGITLADALLQGRLTLDELATSFTLPRYMLSPRGLPEGISWANFQRTFGSTRDARFAKPRDAILLRLRALPGYGQ